MQLYAAMWVSTSSHEIGHAIAALISRDKIKEIRIGHKIFSFFPGIKIALGKVDIFLSPLLGGYVRYHKPLFQGNNPRFVAAGGPGINLIIAFSIMYFHGDFDWRMFISSKVMHEMSFLQLIAGWSWLTGMGNLLVSIRKDEVSDGAIIFFYRKPKSPDDPK